VRVLPPLTPRRRTSGSPSSCASKQTASTLTQRHRQVSKLPVAEFESRYTVRVRRYSRVGRSRPRHHASAMGLTR
jgi:hypothetical protein